MMKALRQCGLQEEIGSSNGRTTNISIARKGNMERGSLEYRQIPLSQRSTSYLMMIDRPLLHGLIQK